MVEEGSIHIQGEALDGRDVSVLDAFFGNPSRRRVLGAGHQPGDSAVRDRPAQRSPNYPT